MRGKKWNIVFWGGMDERFSLEEPNHTDGADLLLLGRLDEHLPTNGFRVHRAGSWEDAALVLKSREIDLIVLGEEMVASRITGSDIEQPVLVVTDKPEIRTAAFHKFPRSLVDFIHTDRLRNDGLGSVLNTMLLLERATYFHVGNKRFISTSYTFSRYKSDVKTLARDMPVLIQGEPGCGKKLAARLMHQETSRGGPMITVDCGAPFTHTSFLKQLLGFEPGAFNGAQEEFKGFVERAKGGTVLLDEVWKLPMICQCSLAGVTDGTPFLRVLGSSFINVEALFISTSSRDLESQALRGLFDFSIMCRLRMRSFYLPPLDRRREDIIPLAYYFFLKARGALEKNCHMSNRLVHDLASRQWPGNIRELENAVNKRVLECADGEML